MHFVKPMHRSLALAIPLAMVLAGAAFAAPATYKIDLDHTFPSFEADHMGVSVWRGKLNKSSGRLTLDKTTDSGNVDIAIDLSSIDLGHDKLNSWARSAEFFNVKRYPMLKRELCGADATANFNRADFGLDMGKDHGFKMDVTPRIQVESLAAQ